MQSWDCSNCTFRHQALAIRCVMCHELRDATRENMRDFIIGKTTTTTTTTKRTARTKPPPQHSVSAVPQPLVAIENIIDSHPKLYSTTNDAAPTATTSGKVTTQHQKITAAAPTTSRQSLQTTTRNPYLSKRSSILSTTNGTTTTVVPLRPPVRVAPHSTNDATVTTTKTTSSLQPPPIFQSTTTTTTHILPPNSSGRSHPATNDATSITAAVVAAIQQQHQQQQPNRTSSAAIAPTTTTTTTNKRAHVRMSVGGTTKKPSGSIVKSTTGSKKRPRSSLTKTTSSIVLPYYPGPVPLAANDDNDSNNNNTTTTWIYPVSASSLYPKRQYQYDITATAIRQNTLVSLPTGLGKTLIAAVVLYNFYRWYPTGKVLFLAPTLPLVDQQVQACYEIMGIPASDTALLTGKVPAAQRTTIWNEKRVFFCTPQTVQRDLEANRCDALKVVCVVLDEAHKSTGEYAYCKVISYLETAGAKFRVLGLSATPGTSIKAIQKVINVLRINCIEARSDNDPDVKQYIHDRQTDVVVVKGMDATKEVEQKLNEIIGPIVDILRKRNVILPQFNDCKAISHYTLLKSQSFINSQPKEQRDNAALGYLAAGICFLQIRTDLHQHGIGTVRSKLQKIQNSRPRGPLATVVRGETFQGLWNEVERVSCNPNAINNTLEEKYKNNPKLKKLCEILLDHFETSKAESTSSRVIVFSQFRTSVSEIVSVLNESKPLIRARHFIGQGKSGGGATTSSNKNNNKPDKTTTTTTNPLGENQQQFMDGMKQDEQKNVIARFKEGVYNTLVCTSIGEEGLDIGEVDLIVNFDCLSSPIRTIQRVGRTGRKRQGRVVTLVAEGHEERTLAKSKRNERTLIHALKDPNSFEVAPTVPMLPNPPTVVEQDMAISQYFHMSQVDGARKKPSNKRLKQNTTNRPWKLTETEEFQRSCILGKLSYQAPNDSELTFSIQLRRRFLNARSISCLCNSKCTLIPRGKMAALIGKMELLYPTSTKPAATNSFKYSGSSIDKLFPFSRSSIPIVPMRQSDKPSFDPFKITFASTLTNDVVLLSACQTLQPESNDIDPRACADVQANLTYPSILRESTNGSEDIVQLICSEGTRCDNNTYPLGSRDVVKDLPVRNENSISSEIQTPTVSSILIATEGICLPSSSPQHTEMLQQSVSRVEGRVRFSLDATEDKIAIFTSDSQQSFAPNIRKRPRRLAINDTPESAGSTFLAFKPIIKVDTDLQNTQEENFADRCVCAICLKKDLSDEDPMILCDGSRLGFKCDLVVHKNCYSAKCTVTDDEEWRCDQCQHMFEGGLAKNIKCSICDQKGGILKVSSNDRWEHITCTSKASFDHFSPRNDLKQKSTIHCNEAGSPEAFLQERKRRRKFVMQQFIDYEADASDADDTDDLEELEICAIEEEEDHLAGDFINDTSQLGFSPDNLDDPVVEQSQSNIDETVATHRVLDMEREKALQFATPMLNRRMMKHRDTDPTSSTGPDSIHGLGNMNFVRSVLEHHRKGGTTDEIEEFYKGFVAEGDEMVEATTETNEDSPC